MNSHRFPPSGGNSNAITFDDPIGLRQRKLYADDHGYPHIHDNWRVTSSGSACRVDTMRNDACSTSQ